MTDPAPSKCPRCGSPLASTDAGGLCPRCLLAMNLRTRTMPTGESPASTPPPSPAELEEKFPQFEILECLGRGGMGVVYKARQKALDRIVAIKILAGEWQDDPGFAERFEKEAKLLARLNHPNIVTIHDFGNAGGLFHIVMEYIDGVNIRDLLRDGKLEPEQALAIIPPICDALQFAHDHGVVHRDIKPENILLDREGRVKIADFGIATIAGDAADRSGTPAYMAPEQAEHAARIDHRADIYALGVVLYEMLTGERPDKDFKGPSSKVQVDVKIDEIVLRALQKSPELRFQTAGEMRTVVETVAGAAPPGNPPPLAKAAPSFLPERHPAAETSPLIPKLALGTLLLSVLGTPLLLGFARRDEGELLFGGLCIVASIVLTILSRKTKIGRTLLWVWGGVLGILLALLVIRAAVVVPTRRAAMEEMRSKARQVELEAVAAREREVALKAAQAETLKEASQAPAKQGPTQLIISQGGQVRMDGASVSLDQLADRLKSLVRSDSDHSVLIAASPMSSASDVTEVLNACQSAGIWNLSFKRVAEEPGDKLLQIDLEAALKSYEDLQHRMREAELERYLIDGGSGTDQDLNDRIEQLDHLIAVLRERIEKERAAIRDLQRRGEALIER